MKPKLAIDFSRLPEDERIQIMGAMIRRTGKRAWCCTESEPGKIERYREKMAKLHPDLVLGDIQRDKPAKGLSGFTVSLNPHAS